MGWHDTQYAETQVRFRCIMDQVFPKFDKAFYEIACPTALSLITSFPTPKDILSADKEAIINILRLSRHSFSWCAKKYDALLTAARESLTHDAAQQSNIIALKGYITLLRTF